MCNRKKLSLQSVMFLRHTRENENGAGALITVGADQQSFKTTVSPIHVTPPALGTGGVLQ